MRKKIYQTITIKGKEYKVLCDIDIEACVEYEEKLNSTNSCIQAFQSLVLVNIRIPENMKALDFSEIDIPKEECKKILDKMLEINEELQDCCAKVVESDDVYEKFQYGLKQYVKQLYGSNYNNLRDMIRKLKEVNNGEVVQAAQKALSASSSIQEIARRVVPVQPSIAFPAVNIPRVAIPSAISQAQELSRKLDWIEQTAKVAGAFNVTRPVQVSRLAEYADDVIHPSQITSEYAQSMADLARNAVSRQVTEAMQAIHSMTHVTDMFINSAVMQVQAQIAAMNSNLFESVRNSVSNMSQSMAEEYHVTMDQVEETYAKIMYKTQWVPYSYADIEIDIWFHILKIKNRSRTENSLANNIDKYMYARFTTIELDNIKRSWTGCEKNKGRLRLMKQAVDVHKQRQYGLTIAGLTTVWDGIIEEKVEEYVKVKNAKGKKVQTWEKMNALADENELKDAWKTYYREFIRYGCSSPEDVKADVPGRNATAHGWFKEYPSRKASLNAILFTDVLLHLETIYDYE